MSILTHHEAPAAPALPTPTKPSSVFGLDDGYGKRIDVRAVVTVQIAMTRDMLAAALNLSSVGAYDEHPDSWSVDRIREYVEVQLYVESPFQLQRDGEGFSELLYDPSVRDRIRAEYRAIDRAYPHFAPKETV